MIEFLDDGFKMGELSFGQPCLYNSTNSNYTCIEERTFSDHDYVVQKIGLKVPAHWNFWYTSKRNAFYNKQFGPSVGCFYVLEDLQPIPWLLVILTHNRY